MCYFCRNFISIYKINRTLHGRLGIRILSSRAESISHSFASLTRERHFQHSKIKFVSPRGHVLNILYLFTEQNTQSQQQQFPRIEFICYQPISSHFSYKEYKSSLTIVHHLCHNASALMSMSFSNVNFFLVSVIWRLLFERHVV